MAAEKMPSVLEPEDSRDGHEQAFTAAGSVLTPETAVQFRALIEEALSGRLSFRDLKDSATAMLAPVPGTTAPQGPGQC